MTGADREDCAERLPSGLHCRFLASFLSRQFEHWPKEQLGAARASGQSLEEKLAVEKASRLLAQAAQPTRIPRRSYKFPHSTWQAELQSLQKKLTAERKIWKEVEAPARHKSTSKRGSNYMPGAVQAAPPEPGLAGSGKRPAEGQENYA